MVDQFADLVEKARTIVRKEGRLDLEAFLQEHPETPQQLREKFPDLERLWRLLFPVSATASGRVLAGIRAELAQPMPLTVADLVATATLADLRTFGLTRDDLEPFEDLEEPVTQLEAQALKDLVMKFTNAAKGNRVAGLLQNLNYRMTGIHTGSAIAARPKKVIHIKPDQGNGR